MEPADGLLLKIVSILFIRVVLDFSLENPALTHLIKFLAIENMVTEEPLQLYKAKGFFLEIPHILTKQIDIGKYFLLRTQDFVRTA